MKENLSPRNLTQLGLHRTVCCKKAHFVDHFSALAIEKSTKYYTKYADYCNQNIATEVKYFNNAE
jgi:predicted component of type VI protein secretion system